MAEVIDELDERLDHLLGPGAGAPRVELRVDRDADLGERPRGRLLRLGALAVDREGDECLETALLDDLAAGLGRARHREQHLGGRLADGLSDAAISIWRFVAPLLQTSDELHARQASAALPRAAAAVSHSGGLSLAITPKTPTDAHKLSEALHAIEAHVRHVVSITRPLAHSASAQAAPAPARITQSSRDRDPSNMATPP